MPAIEDLTSSDLDWLFNGGEMPASFMPPNPKAHRLLSEEEWADKVCKEMDEKMLEELVWKVRARERSVERQQAAEKEVSTLVLL
jgi:hypothetical protein